VTELLVEERLDGTYDKVKIAIDRLKAFEPVLKKGETAITAENCTASP
jgi:hypothetical protein